MYMYTKVLTFSTGTLDTCMIDMVSVLSTTAQFRVKQKLNVNNSIGWMLQVLTPQGCPKYPSGEVQMEKITK